MVENTISAESAQDRRSAVKRLVIWLFFNGLMFCALLMATFQSNDIAGNIVKFGIWVNFVLWVLVFLSGEKGQKPIRDKGLSVGKYVNCSYGLLFSGILAAFGWFGYAGMEITTMIIQQGVFFGSDR